jgi:predicted nucleic acid-binding Zn ribbon protein
MSSRRMFEFSCEAGHITEKYVDYETTVTPCGACGNDAKRIISAVRISLDGTDPVYVSAHDAWARKHEEKAKQERKQNEA